MRVLVPVASLRLQRKERLLLSMTDGRDTKPGRIVRHRTASQLGLPTRAHERATTAPRGVMAVRAPTNPDPIALEATQPIADGTVLEQVLGDRVVRQLRQLQDDLTPPPVDMNNIPREPSAAEAWAHSTNVNRRTVNILNAIAESSGAGMRAGDDIRQLAKKLRFLRSVIVVILIPTAAALITVALKIYSKGFDDGLAAGWKQSVDQRIERIEHERSRRYEPWGAP